jgi:hypothetical protein
MQEALPYYTDDSNKTRYLSFRATGFSVNESRELVGVDIRTVERWREIDEGFRYFDTAGITELRQKHAINYQVAEFQRNFREFQELDRRILRHVNTLIAQGGDLSELSYAEQQYLKTIRGIYSPANLVSIMKAAKGDLSGGNTFNFTQVVNEQARTVRDDAWQEVLDASPSEV